MMTDTSGILHDGTDGHGEASAGCEPTFGLRNTDPAEAETAQGSSDSPSASPEAGGESHSSSPPGSPPVVELDGDELGRALTERDSYLDLARRTQADFENFRKRAGKELADARVRAVAGVARELLPVADNLERALEAVGEAAGTEALTEGIRLVHGELQAVFERLGLRPIDPVGESFDPNFHEAIASIPADGTEPGQIVEVMQKGFQLEDTIVRPARVVVAA